MTSRSTRAALALSSFLVGAGLMALIARKHEAPPVIKEQEGEGADAPNRPSSRLDKGDVVVEIPAKRILLRELVLAEGSWQAVIFAAISLSFVKLMVVSLGDPRLAVAVLAHSGYLAPLAYILMSTLPLVLMLIAVTVIEYRLAVAEAYRTPVLTAGALAALIWILLLQSLIAAAWMLLMTVAMLALFAILNVIKIKSARKTGKQVSIQEYMQIRRREIITTSVLAVAASSFSFITSDTPWAATELVSTNQKQYHGLVLSEGENWLVLLEVNPRTIQFVPAGDVKKREVCLGDSSNQTVVTLIGKRNAPGGVKCPDRFAK